MVHNFHRFGGGSDDSVRASTEGLRAAGHEVKEFTRDSRSISGPVRKIAAVGSALYSPTAVHDFRGVLKGFRPDVVHVHELYPLISPGVLSVASSEHVPTVMTCHDYRSTCPIATHYRDGRVCTACLDSSEAMCVRYNCRDSRLESAAFALRSFAVRASSAIPKNVTLYVTATEFAKNWLTARLNLSPSRFDVVPYPIPSLPTPVDSSNGQYAAFAGRFVVEKGISTLLDAAKISGLPVRLAGDSSTMPDLVSTDGVTLVGQLGSNALRDFYRQARFLVVPSTWFETFGIVAGEAMGIGLPVVASRIGALAEVVDDGRTGLHFAAGDPVDLSEKMLTLWNDPDRCRELGRAGWDKVRAVYSADSHIRGLATTYQRAIELGPMKELAE
jgi:glycosyltransferase involved in cell wall biosynthesis